MILIGTMNLTGTRDRGNFHCPSCELTQTYRLRARRPWLTLYFVPTVPVGNAEMFVECDHCRSHWDPTVLEMDRHSHVALKEDQFRNEALRAALLIVLLDGHISQNEIESLQRIASHLLEREVDREELGYLCSNAQQTGIEAKHYVMSVSKRWNEQQRSRALQAMFLAATAEGEMGKQQVKHLAMMREILEMTDSDYQAAIEDALSWESI